MKNQKGFIVPLLLAIVAVLVIGGGAYVYTNKKAEAPAVVDTGTQQVPIQSVQNQQPAQNAYCSKDAMMCPDGSTVGRVPPSCQFAACPTSPSVKNSSVNVSLDMANQYTKTYKALFTAEFSKPANLDGHFRVVAVGCGSNCMYLYALDKNNGKVYKISIEVINNYILMDNQIRAKLDNGQSIIFIFNPLQDKFQGSAV